MQCIEGSIPVSSSTRIAVVTGGNKGIGLEVCRQLAAASTSGLAVVVVLTARDEARGAAAVGKLRGLGLSNVFFHQLDITDAPSIARLADFLKSRFGKLDILVNNAGFVGLEYIQDRIDGTSTTSEEFCGMDMDKRLELLLKWCLRETCDAGKECMRINYHGTKQVTRALLPLLLASDSGRIVNVSSVLGQLRVRTRIYQSSRSLVLPLSVGLLTGRVSPCTQFFGSEALKRELDDVASLTEERLDEVAGAFVADLEAGAVEARGWWPAGFSPAYMVSKAALNAYSRVLARRHPALRVNCVHPGFVRTDMTVNFGMLTPEEGGSRVVAVALLPDGGPTGAYFQERQQAPFV
ncbi:(+)-neomenthol dehydrogenase isoform X1 [Zea mays]|uniref:(+)-neomenthol dehydrogenase isoform X1 n=1 Tax=Zea mays TaxID=4577 RepID=UPI0009A95285|nr:(+)-neomenthol dehydrogenase isoform X1 [Zea mays]|eukprot:XP_020408704.1 (+)-neomenthol dehydrogenase isoform X1 [Zea mays]